MRARQNIDEKSPDSRIQDHGTSPHSNPCLRGVWGCGGIFSLTRFSPTEDSAAAVLSGGKGPENARG
jgi:hypothetical protein